MKWLPFARGGGRRRQRGGEGEQVGVGLRISLFETMPIVIEWY